MISQGKRTGRAASAGPFPSGINRSPDPQTQPPKNRKTGQKLYKQIEEHLLGDEAPSGYLELVSRQPEFSDYPYNLLLAMKHTEQSPIHHPEGSVWNHTMLVVDQAAKRRSQSAAPKAFMWAALLHDIGKPGTTKVRKGRITAYRHDEAGETLARDFLSALEAPESLIQTVSALVRFHMHVLYVTRNLPFADLNGLKRRVPIREVALLGLCDRLGRTGASQAEEQAQVARFVAQCQQDRPIQRADDTARRRSP